MNGRLSQFLAAENVSQSQFADVLGVARANVSHILSGRNKPGFDFIEKLSSHYPSLNLEWLITGKGKMYKGAQSAPVQASSQDDELFDSEDYTIGAQASDSLSGTATPTKVLPESTTAANSPANFAAITNTINSARRSQKTNNQHNIAKIIVFYDDNTFQELK